MQSTSFDARIRPSLVISFMPCTIAVAPTRRSIGSRGYLSENDTAGSAIALVIGKTVKFSSTACRKSPSDICTVTLSREIDIASSQRVLSDTVIPYRGCSNSIALRVLALSFSGANAIQITTWYQQESLQLSHRSLKELLMFLDRYRKATRCRRQFRPYPWKSRRSDGRTSRRWAQFAPLPFIHNHRNRLSFGRNFIHHREKRRIMFRRKRRHDLPPTRLSYKTPPALPRTLGSNELHPPFRQPISAP